MNLPSELWTYVLIAEFACANNDFFYEVLRFKDFHSPVATLLTIRCHSISVSTTAAVDTLPH